MELFHGRCLYCYIYSDFQDGHSIGSQDHKFSVSIYTSGIYPFNSIFIISILVQTIITSLLDQANLFLIRLFPCVSPHNLLSTQDLECHFHAQNHHGFFLLHLGLNPDSLPVSLHSSLSLLHYAPVILSLFCSGRHVHFYLRNFAL